MSLVIWNALPLLGDIVLRGPVNHRLSVRLKLKRSGLDLRLTDVIWGRPGGGMLRNLDLSIRVRPGGPVARLEAPRSLWSEWAGQRSLSRTREIGRRVVQTLALHRLPVQQPPAHERDLRATLPLGNEQYGTLREILSRMVPQAGYEALRQLAFPNEPDSDRRLLDVVLPTGTPLEPACAAIRRARRLCWEPEGLSPSFDEVACLFQIPLAWIPATKADWEAFTRIMIPLCRHSFALTRQLIAPSKGRWSAFERRCRRALVADKVPDEAIDLAVHLASLNDPLHAASRETERSWHWQDFYGQRALPACLDLSARWHRARRRDEAQRAPPPHRRSDPRWKRLLGPLSIAGVEVKCLDTPRALHREGQRMGHCVGDYAWACWSGRSRILSLTHPQFQSTLELAFVEGSIAVVQNAGPRNSRPDPRAVVVAETLLKGLRDGTLPYTAPIQQSGLMKGTSQPLWSPEQWDLWRSYRPAEPGREGTRPGRRLRSQETAP